MTRRTLCCSTILRGFFLLVCLLLGNFAHAGKAGSNQPPSVQLTSPANGASFVAPASISMAATASDPNGTVTRVDFYQGNTLIGTATSPPHVATWNNVGAGTYSITAKATDNAGAVTTSAPAAVTVTSATALVIASPANNSSSSVSSPLTVSGTFEGPFGSTVIVDNEQSSILATISGNTYTARFTSDQQLAYGPNVITVRLARPDGTSASRAITVNGHGAPEIVYTGPDCDVFDAPANVLLSVDAMVPGGTVAQVQFFRGSTLLATLKAPPYQYLWSGVSSGNYSMTATATSSAGLSRSIVRQIRVLGANTPPTISITAPASGATYTAPASIPIAVTATDPDTGGSIKLVEYFANGTQFGASNVPPYGTVWTNVPAGTYSITAGATDDRGGQTMSAPVSMTVVLPNQPPVVTIAAPAQGATYAAPATIPITATANDPDGSIARVDFYQGTTLLGSMTSAPYTFNWANVPEGSYSLSARAVDNAGATTASGSVSITVSPSPLTILSPLSGGSLSGDNVLVRGTYIGPANTGISVNGVVAVTDQNGSFYAHNVPLQNGTNVLTVKHSTLAGETASRTVTISSDGVQSPISIRASQLSGVAPLTSKFTVANWSVSNVIVQMNGSNVFELPAGKSGAFNLTLNTPFTYPVTVSAAGGGVSASKEFILVSKDGEAVDQMFQGLWSGMSAQLASGSIAQALSYFDESVRAMYEQILTNIAPALPGMFNPSPVIHPTDFGSDRDVEYLTIVQRAGENYGHFLYFSQGDDGVWRLSSL